MSIITRSGLFGRDHLFGPMRDSVLQQSFPRLHHLIATQSTECRYLPPWREEPTPHPCGLRTTIVQSRNISARVFSNPLTTKNLKTCPYNTFLMDLLDKVGPNDWIMIADDDAMLLSPEHVSKVMSVAAVTPTTTVLLQPSRVGSPSEKHLASWGLDGSAIWPMRGYKDKSTAHVRVDMSNLVFHKSMAQYVRLDYHCGADKTIFRQLLANNASYRILDKATVGVGIWANSRGNARGGTMIGHRWQRIGEERPEIGIEMFNEHLASWLSKNGTELSAVRMSAMKLGAVRSDNFIKAQGGYFRPAEVESLRPPATNCTVRKAKAHG